MPRLGRPRVQADVICSRCTRSYRYDSAKRQGHTKTECNSCTVNKRRTSVKQRAVDYLGGKCKGCGYDRCLAALAFHHTEDNKDFEIGDKLNRSWASIEAELKKCVLVCQNCHHEVHAGIREV